MSHMVRLAGIADLLRQIEDFLVSRHELGKHALLVVDEAQRLPEECIELLRYLHDHDDTAFGLLCKALDRGMELGGIRLLRNRDERLGIQPA